MALHPQNVESRVGEALSLGLRVDGDAAWAPLVLAMAEMERNCFGLCSFGCLLGARRCLLFRCTTSRLPMEEMLWTFEFLNLIGFFATWSGCAK